VLFAALRLCEHLFRQSLAASAIGGGIVPARMRQASRDNTNVQSKCRSLTAGRAPRKKRGSGSDCYLQYLIYILKP
jgi:hypothetical protein